MDSFAFCDYDCIISGCYRQVAEVKNESNFISINSGNINDVQYNDIESSETCDAEPEPELPLLVLDDVTQTQTQSSTSSSSSSSLTVNIFNDKDKNYNLEQVTDTSMSVYENENPLNKRKIYNCSDVFDEEGGGCNCYCYSSADPDSDSGSDNENGNGNEMNISGFEEEVIDNDNDSDDSDSNRSVTFEEDGFDVGEYNCYYSSDSDSCSCSCSDSENGNGNGNAEQEHCCTDVTDLTFSSSTNGKRKYFHNYDLMERFIKNARYFLCFSFSEILVSDIFSFAGKMKFRCDMKIL
jgi:hypothetical protein